MSAGFKQLIEEISRYLEPDQIVAIEKSYELAKNAHADQKRQSGEPYITHPVAVAITLAKLQMDYQTIMAALLHDVLEDTRVEKPELIENFGEEVAELVDGVSKLTQITFASKEEAQAENFRKMVLAMVRDIRVILVKLADRLHNMRTLEYVQPEKRRRKALETLEIYAPIANRLGMHEMRLELEDLGFAAYYPRRYRILKAAVDKSSGNRKEIMTTIESQMKEVLENHRLPPVAIFGRKKHLYSIYKKMLKKHLSFNEIMDFYGFRIVTDNIDTCYRALGVVHGLYKPVPEKFKDYIAMSKTNGYQSLHTTLFGPYGVPVEIQIRTADMDNIAEHGIAAHWLYKSDNATNMAQIRAREWMKSLLEIQQSTGNSLEFIENVKIDLFPDEVYVFTPKGTILELPAGATAVDFAYAIHSDIGNTCSAAKINRRYAPLSYKLMNGQTIEIVTSKEARPDISWLNFVVTGKARSNIRHFFKNQQRAEFIEFGKKLLDNILNGAHTEWPQLPEEITQKVLTKYNMKEENDFFEAIGCGEILPLSIYRYTSSLLKEPKFTSDDPTHKNVVPIFISGTEGNVITFASCCRPIPNDPVVGIVLPHQGLIVHREDCSLIRKKHFDASKYFSVQWDNEISQLFYVELSIEAHNQRGLLARISTAISSAESDINHVNLIETEGGKYCRVNMMLSVHHRGHLAKVIRKLRRLKLVVHIARKKI
jgi:guanosine-3',5'-bis(diphosphate) 3'-pyrophosphohydrolase